MNPILYDLVVALFLLLALWQGYRKGFILTLCGFLAVFVAFFGASVISDVLAAPVADVLRPVVEQQILQVVEQQVLTADLSVIDHIATVSTEQAVEACRALAKTEGILCGFSGGAALYAAEQAAKLPENAGKMIVVIIPDSGERYLSGGIFD